MSYQLKNKSKVNSPDWILRFKIDPEKAEKEYFGYYPEMHPDNQNLRIADRDRILIYTLYCLMSDDIKNKIFTLKSNDIYFLEVYLKNTPEHKITEQERAQIARIYLSERELLDVITGLKHFESLTPEKQYELVQSYTSFSKHALALLAVHTNEKVATAVSNKIIKGKDPDLLEILTYNHGRGVVNISRDTLIDSFVKDFIGGKNASCSLSLIKKNAKKLKEEITKNSPLFKLKYSEKAQRYGLNILATKDLQGAKGLLTNMAIPYDLAGVRQIGETLLLEPEAEKFRQKIYDICFLGNKYRRGSVMSGIPENQIKSFARLFALIEKRNPEEWKALCDRIANDKNYKKYIVKREDYINEGDFSREFVWDQMQPFNSHFVRAILFAHFIHGLPLHNAQTALLHTLNESSLNALFTMKELNLNLDFLNTLRNIYHGLTPPEMAFSVCKDFMDSYHMPVVTDEIDIIIDF